ncbi:hypothetical protein HY992_04690 [Candidatus Micrarchaeota archaeon]|nr:hypothetical protein [Candidatus Micrarchaeota archaeon]
MMDELLKSIDESLLCCNDWCLVCGKRTNYEDLHLEFGSLVCPKCAPKSH